MVVGNNKNIDKEMFQPNTKFSDQTSRGNELKYLKLGVIQQQQQLKLSLNFI